MKAATKKSASAGGAQRPTKACTTRLQREFLALSKNPPDHIVACPAHDSLLVWHFVVLGPEDTLYEGGVYHGKLVFQPDYPFSPPAIYMMTPSGRFETNRKLCLSMSDYHPETWSPAWSVASILVGLLSFMLENEITAGSIESDAQTKKRLARESAAFNLRQSTFREHFPMLVEELEEEERENANEEKGEREKEQEKEKEKEKEEEKEKEKEEEKEKEGEKEGEAGSEREKKTIEVVESEREREKKAREEKEKEKEEKEKEEEEEKTEREYSAKQLAQLLRKNNIDTAGMLEKSELYRAAKEAKLL